MAEEEPQQGVPVIRKYRRLKMSAFEWTLIGAMLLTLMVTCIDSLQGQHVGKGDALAVAKLQGQQELMASIFRFK